VESLRITSMQREGRATLSAAHRGANLAAVLLPFVGFVVAIVLLWNSVIGWSDLVVFALMYALTCFGITVGFHRMLTHRAFETYRWLKATFAVLGTMAVEGPAITWVADHRKHHAYADEDGDPHSPHVGHGGGLLGGLKGLWHAHMGWLFRFEGRAEPRRYAADLVKDRAMRVISALFVPLVGVSLALPFALGWLLTGELRGALTGLLWGGAVRIFLLHHMTWSINSVCHFFGSRRFRTSDQSTNVFWLAIPSFGESWHHNHHAFPTSASHGLRWWEIDPAALVIRALERVGLVWNVVKVSPERQAAKAAG
jgi:stearoyl-CoA desaturase (delta-9 desaturase)